MATSPKFPEAEPGTNNSEPKAPTVPSAVLAAPRATTPLLLTYVIHTPRWPPVTPGPALMVGWSRPAEVMVNAEVGKVCPALVLVRTRMLVNAELNVAA